MEPSSSSKQTSGGGYNYNYGGDYAGYSAIGYGDAGPGTASRTFQDYLLIFRERIWYIIVVFLVIFSSALVYTFSQTKIYESAATVQIFRSDPKIMNVQAVMDNEIRSADDLNTQVKILESATLIQKVSERLTGEDLRQFLAPYEKEGKSDPLNAANIIAQNRKILPQRQSLIIAVQYQHPDRFMAAKIANLFVDEYIAYNARVRIDESMKAVEDLKVRVEQQRKRVDELAVNLQNYREKNNLVSLDQRKDIVTEKLKALNAYVTQTTTRFKDAEIRWNQVKERKAAAAPLTDLPFIASQPLIGQMVSQLAAQKISLAQLKERYKDKHPVMIEARNSYEQTERELQKAIDSAVSTIETEYQTALLNDKEARAQLAAQESESLGLDRYAVEYDNMSRDLRINEGILQAIVARTRETSMTSTLETQNARILDRAGAANSPASPKVGMNLALGFVGGIVLGIGFAFLVAFIDDRVKSSFDIEGVVGLPLVGIIPQIKRMEQSEKAQIVVTNADRQVAESFLTLHSSLRLKDESKNAKCILTTSTVPGEGKSFITTNLALTFAAHGERVVIVDCDLRKPNVHKSFKVENLKGLIDVCTDAATLDDVIMRNIQPGLDIIPAGGRAKNPTHILNSKQFEIVVSELRKRYDRVFFDTPPLAAVSDALIVLPLVDGSIFTIYFNKVRRKAAQFSAKKLIEANVPCYGAVLNGLNLAVSGYYYAQYYDKSYKDYYVVMSKEDEGKTRG
ncbi:MAG: polysaccharide biosynthesis tyrosine autokinase [Verrucomicrobia bacterium]|nr:polysaccharide biosynthesis tyrosine autokinase [Verrucomicrobiota bacterium]